LELKTVRWKQELDSFDDTLITNRTAIRQHEVRFERFQKILEKEVFRY